MAKTPSISVADVENAAAELKHRGKPINPYQVRQFLGVGSYKLIEDYLTSLKLVDDYDCEDPLTKKLIGLVRPLAETLQEEKLQGIEQAEARYKKQLLEQKNQCEELTAQLSQRDVSHHHLKSKLADCEQQASESQALIKQLECKLAQSQEQCHGLNATLAEKQKHVDSLEEKHQHSRQALEHFRESVKEQRDKEQRRHEHEIQQLQAGERQADQNLSIRLNEIAQLNRDNARLVAEAKNASKQEAKIANLEQALREKEADYKTKCRDLEVATTSNQTLSEEVVLLRDKQEIWEAKIQEQSLEISSLKTELEVKNRVFDKLGVG